MIESQRLLPRGKPAARRVRALGESRGAGARGASGPGTERERRPRAVQIRLKKACPIPNSNGAARAMIVPELKRPGDVGVGRGLLGCPPIADINTRGKSAEGG